MLRGEVPDPAQADLAAASGRAPAAVGARAARRATSAPGIRTISPARHAAGVRSCRTLNRTRAAKRGGLFLLSVAFALLIPALVYADVPVASISGPEAVVEGDGAEYTVTLDEATGSDAIVVEFTVSGTATEGVDYAVVDEVADAVDFAAPKGRLTIQAGGTEGKFTINALSDQVKEVGETMVVTLTDATTQKGMATLGSPAEVTTMIRPAGTVLVSVGDTDDNANVALEETDATVPMTFQVTVMVPADVTLNSEDLTLGYKTVAGTATEGGDFTGADPGATVSISATGTERTGTITILILGDTLAEAAETFNVMLTLVAAPDGVEVAFARSMAIGTITDEDDLEVSLEALQGAGTQGGTVIEGSPATFKVTLGGGTPSTPVVVDYTVSGTATKDEDYEEPSGTLTIPAGAMMATVTIDTLPDEVLEADETLMVTLDDVETAAGMVDLSADVTATTTLGDRGGKVTVSVDDTAVNEDEEAAEFVVSLSGAVSVEVDLQFTTVPGSATAPEDYTAVNAEDFSIPAGMTKYTISVDLAETDVSVEEDETFTVTLSWQDVEPAGVGLARAKATATIHDDDVLTALLTGPVVVPAGLPARYPVRLTGGTSTEDVVVSYEVTGSATVDVGLHAAGREAHYRARTNGGYNHDCDPCRRRSGRGRDVGGDADGRHHGEGERTGRNPARGHDDHHCSGYGCRVDPHDGRYRYRGRGRGIHREPFRGRIQRRCRGAVYRERRRHRG